MPPPPEILTSCRFYLELRFSEGTGTADAIFLDCKGFKSTQAAIDVVEVTPQTWGKAKTGLTVRTKVPGGITYNNIVLRRGMTCSMAVWDWFNAVQLGNWRDQRRDGSLTIYDQAGTMQARYEFTGAWPMTYTAADVSARSKDLEIEELEMAVSRFVRSPLPPKSA